VEDEILLREFEIVVLIMIYVPEFGPYLDLASTLRFAHRWQFFELGLMHCLFTFGVHTDLLE